MRALFPHRRGFGCFLLIALLAHFFVAHHDGVAELIVCVRAKGGIQIESRLEHDALSSRRAPHHQDGSGEACDHEGGCQDLHLSFLHPELYLGQQSSAAQDQLSQQLSTLRALLATLAPWAEAPPLQAAAYRLDPAPPPQPPPEQRAAMITSTILLI